MTIPKLQQLIYLKHPFILQGVQEKVGDISATHEALQQLYLSHPRSFMSRFMSVMYTMKEANLETWFVLKLGHNFLVSLYIRPKERNQRQRYIIEGIHVHTTRNPEDPFKIWSFREEYKTASQFFNMILYILASRHVEKIYNYYQNQKNTEYTPREFLHRTRYVSLTEYASQLLVEKQFKGQKATLAEWLELKPNELHREEIAPLLLTHFEPLIDFSPWSKHDWYETIQQIPKSFRKIHFARERYEPLVIYKS